MATVEVEKDLPEIILGDDDMELAYRVKEAFGKEQVLPFVTLAQRLTRVVLVRHAIAIGLLTLENQKKGRAIHVRLSRVVIRHWVRPVEVLVDENQQEEQETVTEAKVAPFDPADLAEVELVDPDDQLRAQISRLDDRQKEILASMRRHTSPHNHRIAILRVVEDSFTKADVLLVMSLLGVEFSDVNYLHLPKRVGDVYDNL